MNPIIERELRINKTRFNLSEENWLTNIPLGAYAPSKFIAKRVVKGPPKATEDYSAKELIDQGLVGVYER